MDREPDWMEELREQMIVRRDPWVVLDGRLAVESAIAGWWDISGILADEGCGWDPPAWSGLELLRRSESVLSELAGEGGHAGVLGLARQPEETADVAGLVAELEGDARVVVCPAVSTSRDAGSILRSAAAFGGKGVIFGSEGASPFEREAVEASAGALFRIPVRVADGGQVLRALKAGGFFLIGSASGGGSEALAAAEIPAGRVALVIGSEEKGLGPFWERACDRLVRISGEGGISAGKAAAETVLLWEILRSRDDDSGQPSGVG